MSLRHRYGPASAIGLGVETLVPDAARRSHAAMRARYMARPLVRPMGAGRDLAGRRSDGSEFPAEISLSPLLTDEGEHYLAAIRNVAGTARARQAQMRERYDNFVSRVGQMILESKQFDLTMERMCETLAEAMGMDAAAIVMLDPDRGELEVLGGSGLGKLLDGGLPWTLSTDNPLGRVLATGHPVLVEDFNLARNPRPTPQLIAAGFLSSAIVPLFDLGKPIGTLVVLSRRTRGFSRDDLHVLQSVANLMAAQAQKQRTEVQLAHMQRLEALGQLTGGIAHDFNNLLTVISGNLQLLEMETTGGESASDLVRSAQRAVGHGVELTSKLLTFARRQRFTPRRVDPSRLLTSLAEMLDRTLGEKWHLDLEVAADIPQVMGEAAQIESSLLNLVLNARDAMPDGGTVRVTLDQQRFRSEAFHGELKPGHYVVLSVSDQGCGISEAVLGRIFEPFFTTKPPGRGSGLGLSMVYGYAKHCGGHVAVSSRPGAGARFDFYLPAVDPLPEPEASGAHTPPHRLGTCKVLVVEDEADVRAVASAFVRSFGCEVIEAVNAEEARRILETHLDIHALFTDVVLGSGMSGIDLARIARELRPDIGVVLTSGYERDAQPGDTPEGLLRKPYLREDLFEALSRALRDCSRA